MVTELLNSSEIKLLYSTTKVKVCFKDGGKMQNLIQRHETHDMHLLKKIPDLFQNVFVFTVPSIHAENTSN